MPRCVSATVSEEELRRYDRHHLRHGRHAGASAFRSRTGQPSSLNTSRFHSGVCKVSNRCAWSDTRRSSSSTLTVNERTS